MITDIETVLRSALQTEDSSHLPKLALLLADAASGTRSPGEIQQHIVNEQGLTALLKKLNGQQVTLGPVTFQFTANQFRVVGSNDSKGSIDQRQGLFLNGGTVHGSAVGLNYGTLNATYHYHTPAPARNPEQRNRSQMLDKVWRMWIDGLLQHSLYREVLITLGLSARLDAVVRPLDVQIFHTDESADSLRSQARILDVYDRFGEQLLILGAAGAGKTTLLLELTRDLIQRARADPSHPIPVVFNLSSWASNQRPLAEWLVDELITRYDVGRKIAQPWIDGHALLPLLDGLDEVAQEYRAACVEAINDFRHEQGALSLVVCSRIADYDVLTVKLRLEGAIVVRSLTRDQVRHYLREVGLPLAPSSTSPLWEVLDTPLMLNIATLTYANQRDKTFAVHGTAHEQRQQLFSTYVERMFERRPGDKRRFSKDCTLHWLAWLAWQLQQQGQTVYYLERLQPDWLPTPRARWQYTIFDRLVLAPSGGLLLGLLLGLLFRLLVGLPFGLNFNVLDWLVYGLKSALLGFPLGLLAGLFGGPSVSQLDNQRRTLEPIRDAFFGSLVAVLLVGLSFGLLSALGSELLSPLRMLLGGLLFALPGGLIAASVGRPTLRPRQIVVVEALRWSWRQAWRRGVIGVGFGMLFALIGSVLLGLLTGLRHLPDDGLLHSVGYGLVAGLLSGLGYGVLSGTAFGLVFGLIGGVSRSHVEENVRPNQGIRRSARNALVFGLGYALALSVVFGIVGGVASGIVGGVLCAVIAGFSGGLFVALNNVGYACLSHVALRIVLWQTGALPRGYVNFLDENVDRILLRKVGGGYIFIHRMLLEWFANQYSGPEVASAAKRPARESSTTSPDNTGSDPSTSFHNGGTQSGGATRRLVLEPPAAVPGE